jgi:hypothetical protein
MGTGAVSLGVKWLAWELNADPLKLGIYRKCVGFYEHSDEH